MSSYNFSSRVVPKALVMEKADPTGPYVIEVTNGQWEPDPREKTLVIHAQVRPGVNLERAKSVFQHAAIAVFGERPPAPCLLDWYDPSEVKSQGMTAALPLASMTLIFFPGSRETGVVSAAKAFVLTRRPASVRDAFAHEMRVAHENLR